MKRRSVSVVAALALVTGLAGCGESNDAESGSTTTTLRWQVWAASQAETETWQTLADMVTAKHPTIKIKLQTAAWNDYWTKLPTLFAGGDVPCVVGVQMARLAGIKQFLQPVGDRMAGAGVTPTDFDPTIMQALSNDGQQYALPYDLGPYIMYYNKTAFAKAKLPLPHNGWTVEDGSPPPGNSPAARSTASPRSTASTSFHSGVRPSRGFRPSTTPASWR
jgi:ABC-type glycerol-3-phosphate transport system substrate-binding protein